MTLRNYQKKRNFEVTKEPKGKVSNRKTKNLLFIIQKHAASHLHYDFRLELDGVLLSWAVPKGPCLDPTVKRLAVHVEDHPLEYGSFEGIIPKGEYGGGEVMLWDKGTWTSEDKNPQAAYRAGNMTFTLNAIKLQGLFKLIRINKNDKTWLLMKIRDVYAKPLKSYDITKQLPNSVKSGMSIDEIAQTFAEEGDSKQKKNKKKINQSQSLTNLKLNLKTSAMPTIISPELATLVDKAPSGLNWLHELKLDGYRLIAFKDNKDVRLITRNQHDWTHQFQEIAVQISQLAIGNAIFDGEVVILDDKQRPNFQLLQNSMKGKQANPFIYYIFDLLYYGKYDLKVLPLIKRKEILHHILPASHPTLRYNDHIIGSGKKVFDKTCELQLEGIVSKQVDSVYKQKRTTDWLKIKCLKRQEFVIGGFTKPKGSRSNFGALLVGTYNKRDQLNFNGKVGTGFTQTTLKNIYQKLIKYKNNNCPFHSPPRGNLNVIWVQPKLIAEVEFTDWTKDHILRHPSFKGLRAEKSAKHITQEVPTLVENISGLKKTSKKTYHLTRPDKVLYREGKITKQNLTDYYSTIADKILPYISHRLLALVRCPDGYDKNCFFQKHLTKSMPSTLQSLIVKENQSNEKCIYITDVEGLLALPQLGVLEIHPWGSRVEDIEYPDIITFDLDPAPQLPWKKVVDAAVMIRKYLHQLKLRSFVKTTGGKGLHIVVPIKPEFEWYEVKQFTKTFAEYVCHQHPDQYTSKMTKSKRSNKIFLDYLRNQRGATAVAPYSTRARGYAPVATPLNWDELSDDARDTFYTIKTLPKRLSQLKKDPWQDFVKTHQSLNLDKL